MSSHLTRYHLKGVFSCSKDSKWNLLQIFSMRLGIYKQQVGDQSRCWQTLQMQRFTHQELSQCFLSSLPSRCVPILMEGLLVVSGSDGRLRGCPAQVQTHTEVVMTGSGARCGYSVEFKCQSPCPAPSPLSRSRFLSLSLSRLSPSLFPPLLPQCLSGLVISCHPLQKQITPHTACFPSGSMHTRKTGKHTNKYTSVCTCMQTKDT